MYCPGRDTTASSQTSFAKHAIEQLRAEPSIIFIDIALNIEKVRFSSSGTIKEKGSLMKLISLYEIDIE